jgi:hypothetical protein
MTPYLPRVHDICRIRRTFRTSDQMAGSCHFVHHFVHHHGVQPVVDEIPCRRQQLPDPAPVAAGRL